MPTQLNSMIPLGGQGVDIGNFTNSLAKGMAVSNSLHRQSMDDDLKAKRLQILQQSGGDPATIREQLLQIGDIDGARVVSGMVPKETPEKRQIVQIPDENGIPQPKVWNKESNTLDDPGGVPQGPKYRQMNVTDITKLGEEGKKATALKGSFKDFKDEYAGYNVGGGLVDYSKAAMSFARAGGGTQNMQDAANWWQGYDRFKNKVRNELFGGALTPGEQIEFEKADIAPGMDPALVRKNLARQQTIVESAMKFKSDALKSSGYNPKTVDEAFGNAPQQAGAGAAEPPPAKGAIVDGFEFLGGDPSDPQNYRKAQ